MHEDNIEQPEQVDSSPDDEDDDSDPEAILYLKQQFDIFVQGLVYLFVDPEAGQRDENYYQHSKEVIANRSVALGEEILSSTCKAPFKATLLERPRVRFTKYVGPSTVCAGCWQRGWLSCGAPRYKVNSKKGTYDGSTLEDTEEEHEIESYVTETHFKDNNAVAPFKPYLHTLKVVVGNRCFQRGMFLCVPQ
ncbi:hypothetical protein DFH07DRAFT_291036 [Mycena maculata]|uniref:DUF4211 domain-containing protein n=1 Tax=Mycena maculata TaxID=230809 RepID=A0AAD7JPB5_9AGAR|nr:hypothetical protein DFH07DRAFT_291036 [Mycena maculata]